MKQWHKTAIVILILNGLCMTYGQDKTLTIIKSAELVDADTYGTTYWDNLVDRGSMFYLKPVYKNDFKDRVTFIKLPDLEKTTVNVPLEDFFNKHKKLLYDNALYSTLKNGKERKNYWIEDCFYYDTENGEAGLRVLNYYLLKKGNIQRTYIIHWDLKRNIITKAVLLQEHEHQPQKGEYEYTATTIDPIGYNHRKKIWYYLNIEADIKVELDGKYRKYIYKDNGRYGIYTFKAGVNRLLTTIEIGSRDTTGLYNADLNIYFLPAYKDFAHVSEKMNPEGFVVNLDNGTYKRIAIQRHTYWADIDHREHVLYHVSSSTGKLWATDMKTGMKTAELYVGDAGDDRYRKLGLFDTNTLLYYLKTNILFIDTATLTIRKTVNLSKQCNKFGSSSPGYILPGSKGIIVEARTDKNKTTGFLYYVQEK